MVKQKIYTRTFSKNYLLKMCIKIINGQKSHKKGERKSGNWYCRREGFNPPYIYAHLTVIKIMYKSPELLEALSPTCQCWHLDVHLTVKLMPETLLLVTITYQYLACMISNLPPPPKKSWIHACVHVRTSVQFHF